MREIKETRGPGWWSAMGADVKLGWIESKGSYDVLANFILVVWNV